MGLYFHALILLSKKVSFRHPNVWWNFHVHLPLLSSFHILVSHFSVFSVYFVWRIISLRDCDNYSLDRNMCPIIHIFYESTKGFVSWKDMLKFGGSPLKDYFSLSMCSEWLAFCRCCSVINFVLYSVYMVHLFIGLVICLYYKYYHQKLCL